MAHHATGRPAYQRLVDRLNRFPQGAPPSDLLYRILEILFSEREAALVALLPIRPFGARTAARIWKLDEAEARKILDELASRAILLDVEQDGEMLYVLPPPMAGFFEFSMMRVRSDVDQPLLARLYHQYVSVEDDFIKALFTDGATQLGRTFVSEPALSAENALHVLDHERASHVIRSASEIGVSLCYCRHKARHAAEACDAPLAICMTFNASAKSLVRHGHARRVDVAEAIDLLAEARHRGLVQFGENVREEVNFICHCCGCCCEAMLAQKRFGLLHPIHTTRFLPVVDGGACGACGGCVDACPVGAITVSPARADPGQASARARVDETVCLGCGVCVTACPTGSIGLEARTGRVITPVDSTHRVVTMAIERGKLQNLIFDRQALWSHRAMAAILGVVLKLPPVKRALAARQVNSRYIEAMIARRTGSASSAAGPAGILGGPAS